MKRLTAAFLVAVVMCIATGGHAATVTHNGYTLDTDTNIVTGGGLRWLQWDQTVGLTLEQALAVSGGMRLASNAEVAGLFNVFDFGGIFDGDPSTSQLFLTPPDSSVESTHEDFVELFGFTTSFDSYGFPDGTEGYKAIRAFFGGEADNGILNMAGVRGDAFNLVRNTQLAAHSFMGPLDPNNALARRRAFTGYALVSEVPIPASIWLFCSALAGVAAVRQKRARGF